MATKQLGKLRQWAGEVISTKDKTTVSEEFRKREKEIELRKEGLHRLHIASESYLHYISKKKESDALDDAEKLLPIDTLGIIMVVHGEEIEGMASPNFSNSLVKLGRAHCRIATVQEAFALTFKDTVISSLDRFLDDIKEYEALRKKLESKRLTLDAAITKSEKAKKDKDKKEAEEEVAKARSRYEETEADVHGYMKVIQDNEIDQQRVLGSLLDTEISYVQQYLDLLKEVKFDWDDGSVISKSNTDESPITTHIFSRPSKEPKFSSVRSRQSATGSQAVDSSDEEDYHSAKSTSRRQSVSSAPTPKRRGSSGTATTTKSPSIKPPSRPSSRASRKSIGGLEDDKTASRLSVASWVGSVTGKNKKSRERLDDDDEVGQKDDEELASPVSKRPSSFKRMLSSTKSKENITSSPVMKSQSVSSLTNRKCVRALHDFSSGKSDELSFVAGDQIVVISEVLDGWWMGELHGQKGLFPTTYTEVVEQSTRPPLPPRIPSRPSTVSDSDSDSIPSRSPFYDESTADEEEVETQERQCLMHNNSSSNGFTNGASPKESFLRPRPHLSSTASSFSSASSSSRNLLSNVTSLKPKRSSTAIEADSFAAGIGAASGKRAPPPPPPRRSTLSSGNTSSRPGSSSGSLPLPPSLPRANSNGYGYDTSPFDSTVELGAESEDPTSGCGSFKQNPFKPKGMCSNCFEYHSQGL